jgi:maltooligosyltrehalose trehalohydrolase
VHCALYELHRELLRLRREQPALANLDMQAMELIPYYAERVLFMRRRHPAGDVCVVISLSVDQTTCLLPVPEGDWRLALNSAARQWVGPGTDLPRQFSSNGEIAIPIPPLSCSVYIQTTK